MHATHPRCRSRGAPFVGGLAAAARLWPQARSRGRRRPRCCSRAPAAGHLAADQVLDVMDFEPLARAALPPAHFGYIATGVDDDLTVVRNARRLPALPDPRTSLRGS